MNRIRHLWRIATTLVLTGAFWWNVTPAAMAGEAAKSEGSSGGPPYVGPYFLLVFALGLGLFAVCNPSRRRDRARPEQYEDKMAQKLKSGH